MDGNSTKNESTMVGYSLTGQILAVNDEQQENSIPCEPYPATPTRRIQQAKKKPMNPTPLYIFPLFHSDHYLINTLQ